MEWKKKKKRVATMINNSNIKKEKMIIKLP